VRFPDVAGTNLIWPTFAGLPMPRMVEYEESDLFPFPRDRLWKLLQAHNDPATIGRIHPLIQRQSIVAQNGDETTLRRSIAIRGKSLTSDWRITFRPPDLSKYEILSSEGPWSEGSSVENHYSDNPVGTMIRSRIKLHIKVLPFFLPQKAMARRILNNIDREDRAFLAQLP
jgi:hypothetical protein